MVKSTCMVMVGIVVAALAPQDKVNATVMPGLV